MRCPLMCVVQPPRGWDTADRKARCRTIRFYNGKQLLCGAFSGGVAACDSSTVSHELACKMRLDVLAHPPPLLPHLPVLRHFLLFPSPSRLLPCSPPLVVPFVTLSGINTPFASRALAITAPPNPSYASLAGSLLAGRLSRRPLPFPTLPPTRVRWCGM